MNVKYTVGSFIKDNLNLYVETKNFVDNYEEIFISRARRIYGPSKCGFWRKIEKTDKDYYADYVNDERVLGADQIEFVCDKNGASDFCSTMKYLIDYSGARYDKDEEGNYQITHIENVEFFNSVIDVSKKDLSNIKRAKLYNEKYFK